MNLLAVKDVKVTDRGGKDIPCDGKKVRRTYAVAGVKRSDVDDSINMLNMLAGGLGRRGYKISSVDRAAPRDELVKKDSRVKTVTTSSRKNNFVVSGEAECLRMN
ncbi:hypothetical protein [Streptosporangium sp. NPDC002607]